MSRQSITAAIFTIAAPTLIFFAGLEAVTAGKVLPPVPITDVYPNAGYTEAAIPRCVLHRIEFGQHDGLPQCSYCQDRTRPDSQTVLGGASGECAEISGERLDFTNTSHQVNLRCASLTNVVLTSSNGIMGMDLSYAVLRDVRVEADTFNAVMQCADMSGGSLTGDFIGLDLGAARVSGVDLRGSSFRDLRAAHTLFDPSHWPLSTAGDAADSRIRFIRPEEAATLLPRSAAFEETDNLAQIVPGDSVAPLSEMRRRINDESAPFLDARLAQLQAGIAAQLRLVFASGLGHTLLSVGAIWGLATGLIFLIIGCERGKTKEERTVLRRASHTDDWVSPTKDMRVEVAIAGWAALQSLWKPLSAILSYFGRFPAMPGLEEAVGGVRLTGGAAWVSWAAGCCAIFVASLAAFG